MADAERGWAFGGWSDGVEGALAKDTSSWPPPGDRPRTGPTTSPAIRKLQQTLASVGPGPCPTSAAVLGAIVRAWSSLHGSYAAEMCREKVVGRIVELHWNPPVLSLGIRRDDGSAEHTVQPWQVDVQDGVAWVATDRRLELPPKADAAALAFGLVDLLVAGSSSTAIVRKAGGRISIRPGEVPGLDVGFSETLPGRHCRFRAALDQAMAAAGFVKSGPYRYRQAS